jgi:hypothetical protein
MILNGPRAIMISLGSGLQLSIVNMDGKDMLVVETIAVGGQSLILGSATKKTLDGIRFCLDAIQPVCNP